ncbi:MAG TPA: radical SAM protein [Gemmatimonadaceae bacterium]|nr:radical SAM protein [Gemmatimonadaceae bacterium]
MATKMTRIGYQMRFYRALRAANRRYSPAHDMAAQPFPALIQLQTINACNASCVMCPYPLFKKEFPRGRMDDELFEKIIAEIADRPEVHTFVPMLQNEPFLDKKLFDRIARFKQVTRGRVEVELVTNGAFLTAEAIERIRDVELDVLDISLDAVSKATYERIRIGLDFEEVIAGVERVIDAQLPRTSVFVRLVKLRDNAAEVREFATRWRARGIPVFIYTANNRVGALPEFDEKLRLTREQVPLIHRIGRRAARAWLGHCPAPFATTDILHDGSVLLCTHDWARKEILGNVRDQTIAEIWNGERMREIRAAVYRRDYETLPACRNCSLWKDGWV